MFLWNGLHICTVNKQLSHYNFYILNILSFIFIKLTLFLTPRPPPLMLLFPSVSFIMCSYVCNMYVHVTARGSNSQKVDIQQRNLLLRKNTQPSKPIYLAYICTELSQNRVCISHQRWPYTPVPSRDPPPTNRGMSHEIIK